MLKWLKYTTKQVLNFGAGMGGPKVLTAGGTNSFPGKAFGFDVLEDAEVTWTDTSGNADADSSVTATFLAGTSVMFPMENVSVGGTSGKIILTLG